MPEEFDIDVTSDWIKDLTADRIFDAEVFDRIFRTNSAVERSELISKLELKAKELSVFKQFQRVLKAHQDEFIQSVKQQGSKKMQFTAPPIAELNSGEWTCNDTGVYRTVVTLYDMSKVYACQHPILPTMRLKNLEDGTEKIELAFYKDKHWQRFIVDRSKIATPNKIVDLSDRGVEVTSENAKDLIRYISDVVALNTEKIPVCDSISRLGWVQDGFAPYVDGIKYDGDIDFKGLYDDISERGSYESWKEYCLRLRQNIYLRLQMAASFASPIIEKIGALPFVFHLWGGTGSGKTVGMMAAMSIWGNPSLGHLTRTLNMTQNSMARTAAFLYAIPFAGDELQILKNKGYNLDSLIMFMTEGMDRGRAKAYGGVERLKTWRNSFIFTGEEPITKNNSGGGVKNRVIEVEVEGVVVENGNETANFLRDNYGFAGREFIKALSSEDLTAQYQGIVKDILDHTETTDKQAMAMACMLLADALAVKYIFTNEKSLCVEDVKSFLQSKKEIDTAERAYSWTLNWIAQNENRFSKESVGEIWGKIDGDIATINKNVYVEALANAGFDYNAVIKKMAERGRVCRNSQNRLVHCTQVNGKKALYVKIDMSHLEDDDNEWKDIDNKNEDTLPFDN